MKPEKTSVRFAAGVLMSVLICLTILTFPSRSFAAVTSKAYRYKMTFAAGGKDWTPFANDCSYDITIRPKKAMKMASSMSMSATILIPVSAFKEDGDQFTFRPWLGGKLTKDGEGTGISSGKYNFTLIRQKGQVVLRKGGGTQKLTKPGKYGSLLVSGKNYVVTLNTPLIKPEKKFRTATLYPTVLIDMTGHFSKKTSFNISFDNITLKSKETWDITFDKKNYSSVEGWSWKGPNQVKGSIVKVKY